jgi:hypothetical protein
MIRMSELGPGTERCVQSSPSLGTKGGTPCFLYVWQGKDLGSGSPQGTENRNALEKHVERCHGRKSG